MFLTCQAFKGQDDGSLDFKEEKLLSITSKARLSDSPRSTDDGGRSSSKSKQVLDESKPVVKESTPSSSAPSKEKDRDRGDKEKEKTKLVKSESRELPAKKEKKEVDGNFVPHKKGNHGNQAVASAAKLPAKENVQTPSSSEQPSPSGGKASSSEQPSPSGGKAGQRRQHSSESSSTPENIIERGTTCV